MLGATGASALLGFLASLLVGRHYGAEALGLWGGLFALTAILGPLLVCGADALLLRHAAREQTCLSARVLHMALIGGVGGVLLSTVVIVLAGSLMMGLPLTVLAVCGLLLFGKVIRKIGRAALQAQRRDYAHALLILTQGGGRGLTAAVAVGLTAPFCGFLFGFALFEAAVIALLGVTLWRYAARLNRSGPLSDTPDPGLAGGARELWQEGRPFAWSGLLFAVYYQVDIVMLGALAGFEQAGLYNAAALFLVAVYLPISAFFRSYMQPRIYRWWERSKRKRLPHHWQIIGVGVVGYGVAVAFLLNQAGPWLLYQAYGDGFDASGPLLQLLAISAVPHVLSTAMAVFLITERGIRLRVRMQAVVAALNVLLNLVLIPFYGALGAVVATLVAELSLMLLYGFALSRVSSSPDER